VRLFGHPVCGTVAADFWNQNKKKGCLFSCNMEAMDTVDVAVRDESEIFVSIKTTQDNRKVSVCPTGTVKEVFHGGLSKNRRDNDGTGRRALS